jgi:hypothetical protein
MSAGWITVILWVGSNVAFGAWRIYVTRHCKVAHEPVRLSVAAGSRRDTARLKVISAID